MKSKNFEDYLATKLTKEEIAEIKEKAQQEFYAKISNEITTIKSDIASIKAGLKALNVIIK